MRRSEMIRNTKAAVSICLALTLLLASAAVLATPLPDAFNMMVISNESYGQDVIDGDHEFVIEKLGADARRKSDRFAASNNLCVAYVNATQLDRAKKECKRAVNRSRLMSRRDQAIALSNLGVIRALTGNKQGAMHSFKAAIRLSSKLQQPADNLARLNSKL